jgi:citrate lyase subunit beta/citryl-CoA lyase
MMSEQFHGARHVIDPFRPEGPVVGRRRRRACLAVSATSSEKLAKAAGIEVDEIVIDLEDSVPVGEKNDQTRARVVEALLSLAWAAPTVAVRVNGVTSPWFRDDVTAIVRGAASQIGCIIVPMVEGPDDVLAVATLLAGLAAEDRAADHVGLEALVETARGVVTVEQIAESSRRLEALIFGPGDYAASMGLPLTSIGSIEPSYPGDQWAYPRARIAVAARASGIDPIDGPYADFRDIEGMVESARRARLLGFAGKWVIHPAQVEACTLAFSPSAEEKAQAERVAAALDAAARAGAGAAAIDGEMVDAASIPAAQRVLPPTRR